MDTLGLVLPLVAFLAAMGLVLAVTNLFGAEREVLQERLTGYGQPTGHTMAIGGTGSTILKEREFSGIPLVQSLLSGSSFADQWAVDLVAAGLPLRVGEYLLLRWISAIAFAAVALLAGLPSLFAIPAAVLGFYVPKFYVGFKQQQRVGKFNDQLVDALSMMANALKSGSSFLQAIDLVARELPAPVSEEFGQVVAEVSVGAGLDEALTNLTKRIKSYDLYLVVTAMIIQRQTGGNLAEVLENIAYTIRERMRLLRQVQVLTAQQRLSAIVVALLPLFLLIVLSLTTPSYHGPFLASTLGRIMLAVAFVFQVLGFVVMNRLAQIDV
ncbi:MAG TPA: type II secretion system F family protein [Chloroflexota bacterium]|nr:type II secretion system F family protein [Chloroflexota bacterium]